MESQLENRLFGTRIFTRPGTPDRGNDWVLVLDDASRKFPALGVQPVRK
jgi:hypothetical protein